MIDGLGTHSFGSLPTLHQIIAKVDGKTIRTWPLTSDKAAADRHLRMLKIEEDDYKAECDGQGDTYNPTIYSIFSANADLFA